MPARCEIDVEHEVVFAYYWGVVTFEEGRDILRIMRDDPRVRPQFRSLADFSRAEAVDLWFDRTVDLVEYYRTAGAGPLTGRVAFYVPRRNVVYGALRQFLAMAHAEGRIAMFTDLAEARAWVGLPAV